MRLGLSQIRDGSIQGSLNVGLDRPWMDGICIKEIYGTAGRRRRGNSATKK